MFVHVCIHKNLVKEGTRSGLSKLKLDVPAFSSMKNLASTGNRQWA